MTGTPEDVPHLLEFSDEAWLVLQGLSEQANRPPGIIVAEALALRRETMDMCMGPFREKLLAEHGGDVVELVLDETGAPAEPNRRAIG